MSRRSLLTIEQILNILTGTPQRIAMLTAGLTTDQLHTEANPDDWSINDVLAHLRACNDVWGGNILTIIAQDKPTIKGINPRARIKKTNYFEQEFKPSLLAFTTQRIVLLDLLDALPPESWLRTATVIDMVGKDLERTILSYADSLARHERTHLKQIERMVSTMRM
jgi:hypothetical protein